jgi:LysM repeat protein
MATSIVKNTLVKASWFLVVCIAACSQNPSPVTNKSNFIYAKEGVYEIVTVEDGDTLSSIGRRFGINALDLAKYNEIIDLDRLAVGMTIKIPLFKMHRVQDGETLEQIAGQYCRKAAF